MNLVQALEKNRFQQKANERKRHSELPLQQTHSTRHFEAIQKIQQTQQPIRSNSINLSPTMSHSKSPIQGIPTVPLPKPPKLINDIIKKNKGK